MKLTISLVLAIGCVVMLSACGRVQAKATPALPPLDVPVPPPRDVEANDAEARPPVPVPEEPARPASARPRPVPARPEASKQEPPKTEPSGAELSKPEESARPPTTLQTTPAGAEDEMERTIRMVLTRATADLNRVNYRTLSADARMQYDTAKRFVNQAQDAVRAKNLVFARNLADKAATLAAQLAGR